MKSLKHFASFDWSAEIDDGHMLSWILNVAAAGPETGRKLGCRPWPRSAALLLV